MAQLAAFRNGKIVSLHHSHKAAEKAAGKNGQVLYPAGYENNNEAQYTADGEQLFIAPEQTGYHFVSINGFYDQIY